MEAPEAALDSQPPHWIVGMGRASDDGGKGRRSGTDAASRKFGISESEVRRTAGMGFDSPHSTNKSNNELKNRRQ